MKILQPLIPLLIIGLPVLAQNREIEFKKDSLNAGLKEAKKLGKIVFVDCYTSWCGPCKQMAATVFKTDSVADFFNENLVSVSLDMEKGEGVSAGKKYKVGAYPSFLLLNGNGEVLYKFVGGMPANEFMEKIRTGLNPDNKIAMMNKMYAAGNRTDSFISNYIRAKIEMMEINEAKQLAKSYFAHMTDEQKTAASNWFMFGENRYRLYLSDIHSETFNYLSANWRAFVPANGKDVVEKRLGDMYRKIAEYTLEGYYLKGHPYNKAEFETFKKNIRSTELADKDQLLILMDIAAAAGEGEMVKVSDILADNIEHFSPQNQHIAYAFWTWTDFGKKAVMPRMNEIYEKILKTSHDEYLTGLVKSLMKN